MFAATEPATVTRAGISSRSKRRYFRNFVSSIPTRNIIAPTIASGNDRKMAAILHGVYARYQEGKKSTEGVDLELLLTMIEESLAAAVRAIQQVKEK